MAHNVKASEVRANLARFIVFPGEDEVRQGLGRFFARTLAGEGPIAYSHRKRFPIVPIAQGDIGLDLGDHLAGAFQTERQFRDFAGDTVKLVLMRGPERIELADLGIDTDFLHDERVAGGNGFDFGKGERGVLQIFDTARGDIAAHDLGDEARFDLKELPQ